MDNRDKKIYIPTDYLNFEDKKTLSILIDLNYWKNSDNLVNITLDKIIKDCGYAPKTGKGKSNEKFKTSLCFLQEKNIIECEYNLKEIKLKQMITIKLEPYSKERSNIMIYYSAYKKIMEDNVKSNMKDNMLLIYLLIKKGIGAKNTYGKEIKYKMITNKTLMKKSNTSKDTLNGCIKEISGLGLLCYDNIGYIIKNDKCKKAVNVYALDYEGLDIGLKASKKYYEEKGYKFETRENKKRKLEVIYEDLEEEELSLHDKQMIEIMELMGWN